MDVFLCSESEAKEKILHGILDLTSDDFAERTLQWSEVYDVYGHERYLGHNWYIKFAIYTEGNDATLEEVSFHPIEKVLHLQDGRILDVSWEGL